MKNKKAIIILSLLLLILMITTVSAKEVNSTDTISTTGNIEVSSVSIENNIDTISTVDDIEFNSENNVDETNGVDLKNEHVNGENTVSGNSSNVELEQKSNVVCNSVQNKEELLGVVTNILTSSGDVNNPLTNNDNNILSTTSNELLSENPSITVKLGTNTRYLVVKIECTSVTNLYQYTITDILGDSWDHLILGSSEYTLYEGHIYRTLSNTFTCYEDSETLVSYCGGYRYQSGIFEFPVLPVEVETQVKLNSNPSVKYNSGTFDVSGTVTASGTTVNGGTVTVTIGSTSKTATVSNGAWTASGFSSTAYGITSKQSISLSYGGVSGSYKASTGSGTLTVSKNTPEISFDPFPTNVIYNGNTYTISGKLSFTNNNINAGTAKISLTVGSNTYTATVNSDGSWSKSGISSTDITPNGGTIKAKYIGNDFYTDSAEKSDNTLNVAKNTPIITINTINDVTYNGNAYSITGTANAQESNNNINEGTITLTTNTGKTLTGTTTWSGGTWTVSGISSTLLDPGTYAVTAKYTNTNYNDATSESKSLTVNKITPTVNVNPISSFTYNTNVFPLISGSITGGVNGLYEGYVNITIDDELVASDVSVDSNGLWTFTFTNTGQFKPDTYSVKVNYSGNDFNKIATGTGSVTITLGQIDMQTVPKGDINVGDVETIKVTLKDYYTYDVLEGYTVVLSGTGISDMSQVTDSNGETIFTLPNLAKGYYSDWKVNFYSNDYHGDRFSSTIRFYVKSPVAVIIDSVDPYVSTYPDAIIVTGHADAGDEGTPHGNVSLILGDKIINVKLNDTCGFTATFEGVIPGNYSNITCEYIPDADEPTLGGVSEDVILENDNIIINKYSPVININNVFTTFDLYPGNATVTGIVSGASIRIPSGKVYVKVNGVVYGSSDVDTGGYFSVDVSNLPCGRYNVVVYYEGDDYYTNRTDTAAETITINPNNVKFNITSINGTYNVDAVSTRVNVKVTGLNGGDNIAKGTVRIVLKTDPNRYWESVLDDKGEATISINALYAGDHIETIQYIPSADELSYTDTNGDVAFTIYKANPGLVIKAPSVGAGKDAIINITLNYNTTGNVTLHISGKKDVVLDIGGGANRSYAIRLEPGAYDITAEYSGDVNFNSSEAEAKLFIERPESYLNYTVSNISYGQSQNIRFEVYLDEDFTTLASNATGTIRVYGLDKNYKINVVDGLAYLSVDDLTKGDWTIVAIYSGNEELGGSDRDDKFTINGLETPLIITADNDSVIAGNDILVTVTVNNTINDSIKLFVDNKYYYSNTTINGITTFILRNLTYGNHNISAVFEGNSGFNGSSNNTTVTVNRIDVNPVIDISVNRDIVFDVNVADDVTGQIRIKGNGTDETILIVNGNVNLTVFNPARGDYKFNISYIGNWKYLPFDIEKTFTVNPVDDYNLTIESTTAEFNKTVTITVAAFADLEGKIINLTVDGVNKGSAEVIGGLATFNNIYLVSNTIGEFKVIASYDGDNTYASKSFTLNVPVIPTKDYIMGLKALDLVYVGDNILINITAPELINNLNITINGKTQLITREDFIYHIDDIDEGEYNILVSYAGDKAYASKTNTTSFNVIKKDSNIIIETGDIYYNDDEVINISVSDGVSGYVLVTIDNKTSKYDLNGNATQIIRNDFTAGLHNVTVVYPGDRKYNSFTKTGNFTVFKDYDYNMVVSENGTVIVNNSVLHKFVDHTLVVDVSLPGDAGGNLTFKLYDINHNLITNWTNVLPKNLINYELREVTNYTLEIFYTGDNNYENNTFVFDINVHKFLIDADASFVDNPYFVLSDSLLNITSNLNDRQIRVYIDGIYYTLTDIIHDNKTVVNLSKLSAGNHTISLMYNGDEYYTSLFATHNITVSKLESSVNVTASSVRTDNNVIVDVNASGSGSANIVILNGMNVLGNYNITITNGKGSFILPNRFVNGTYDLIITYLGDEIYYPNVNSTTFNVTDKIQSDLNITRPTFIVNTPSTVDVTTNFPTGTVSVYVDGIRQDNITVNNRAGIISLAGLSAGNHTILVTYAGDYNYTELTKSFDIFVEKHNSTVNVTATSVRTGNPVVVSVNASGSGSANIVIFNNTMVLGSYNITVNNGKGSFIVPLTFVEGTYNLNITYYGDDVYYGSKNTTVFAVTDRIVSDLNITRPVFVVNTPSTVDVTANFPSGTVSVYVDGKKQNNININAGKGVIDLEGLSAGNHTIQLVFDGNYDYTNATESFNIFVEKLNSSVNVTATSVRTGNPVVVSVNASGSGSANIVIFNNTRVLGSYNITINNGKGSFIIPLTFVEGTYNLNITYYGDDIYYGNKNTTVFAVTDRIVSDLNITRPIFVVNTPSTVDVTANFPSGTVSVYVDGKKQNNININAGKGVIDLEGLSAGNHTIQLVFGGNYDYTNATESFNIFVEKLNSSVNVTATSVRTGNPVVVSVNASGSGSANIVIFNNTMVLGSYNITVNDGKGSFIVPLTFVEGTYNLNISYYGDDVYYGSKNTTVFAVTDRIVSDLNITRPVFVVNTPSTVDVTANFPSGSVSVYVDGKKQNNININAGKGVIDLEGLSAGNHTIQLSFDGNYDYTNATESFNIFVEKLNSSVNVTATSVRTGNPVVVSVNASGSGSANIVIFNNTMVLGSYNITVNDGKGSFIVPLTFVEGTYNLNITYYGDDVYYGSKNTTVFTVTDRIQSVIDFIEPAGYIVNKTITIGLSTNFPTGEITVYVDGKKQTTIVNINNNEGTLDLGILSNGNHTIQVTYNGDYDYTETSNNITIDVLKLNTTIAITVDKTFYVDDLVEITINVNKSATGYISVNVNNKDYRLKITEGVAKLNITDLKENTYTIYAEYLGDDYFYGNDTDDAFTVSKIPVSIVIPESIVVGDDLVIDFTNNHADNDEITGVLNITIGSENIVVNVVKGMASIPVSRLPEKPDTYDVVANYSGNYKFNNTILNTALMIKKLTTHTASADANVTIDENLTVIITGDRGYGVDGNLTVSVNNGDSFIIPVNNGIAVIPSDKLPQVMRDNIITIKYSNGTFYADKDFTLNVHSDKITVYDFIISNATVCFGENATLEINLPKDVTTSLTVKINDDTKTVNIENGYGKLENIANLHAGDNSVAATFTSDKYETGTAIANILVVPNDITLNITVPSEQLYVDQSATINVKANVSMNNSVTVYVNGKAQTVNLTNGEGGFTIDPLVYGDYVFTAIFDGNENYTYTIASEKSFSVDKNNITLNVSSSNVIVGHDVNIKVNINTDATGLVIVKINNVEYSLNVTNNEYTLSVPNLGNGTYTITAKYYGDDKYYGFENTTSVEVLKLTPSISANDTILIGEDLIITVENATSLVDKATGKLNLTIDNFGIIEADVVNGIAVIKASDLPQVNKTYTASVEYTGDNNYYSLIQAITFTINKVPEVIITVPSNVTIDSPLIITVGDSTTDGKLNVTIGSGNEFSLNVVNGTAVIPVSELPQVSDNYNISIYYHSGSYWNNLEYNTTFHADKITVYPFNITNPTIRFGENATLEITLPNDVNTTLTVKINDITSTVDIKNGYGKLENISGLHAKANSVSATFGNGKYETSTVTSTIQVDPNDMTLTITVPTEQLYVDQSALISIKANVSMNNTVTVYVNGKAQTVKLTNGEGGFTITPLVYGDYVFTAIFDGNENYTYTTAGEKSFSVDKINITLNVTTSNVVVGHDINIKVNINDDATGLVIVKVDSTEYSLNVGNKEYSLGVSGLGNGTHNIVVKYYGDDKYYGDENSTTVEILKLTPSIAFSSDILIAEDFIISITNSSSRVENPSGKLIFTINGNPVEVDVVNGVATIKASDLPVTDNTYTALVEYSGDNNYYPLTESVTFTINKVPRLVITVPGNVTIDDELIISVGDDTTDGKLNVTIGSGEKFTVNVINGTATIPVKYLPQKSNIYAIALDYYDGSYWNDTSVVRSFHADKITDYPFIISNDTIKFDGIATLRFTLPSDVNTTLTVIIDDIVKTVSITEGHGVLSIANLHAGVNLVSTSFGSDKYETSTATSFIRVLANEITLNITVPTEQLYVDQSATVSVQANVSMNNSVIVYVNGEARTLNLSNGKAEFTINPLVYGKYVFTALFEGNENYTRANAEMKSFTVDKNTPSITVSVEDILVDEDALVTISNLPEDSKGIVLININGTVYSINTVKGKGNLTVPGLKYGKYNVTVNFTGDDKYHSNINTTSFSVWKNAIGEIKVRSETIKDNKTQVTVTVEKHDATGEVIITTPNGEYIGKFLDGKTVIEVTDLTSVETPFNITYVGDAKYLSNTTNGVIVKEGIFIESWVTVSAPDIMVDEKTLITVNVPDDATGFVKITVNGKTIQLPLVDAVATFKIGDLPAGEQTITVTYLGDDKYYNNTNSTTFHVNKYSTSISVEADDGMAGTPTTVTVKANASDVNGNVTVTVNGVNFTGNMENGIAVLNITIDNAGDNVITAVYEGNTYYNTSTASGSVNMDYADAFVNVDAWDINVGEYAIIMVTLPDDATGNVTLTLNDNNDYKPVIIENGTAKFSISDLSADTYNVVVKYLGDNKYNPKSNGTVFVVSKVEVSPSAGNNTSVEVIKNDNGTTTINITVPDDATGNVTVTVDGKNYTVPIVNGTASVTVDNLNNDSNVSITYSGDDKYDGFNQTTVINSDGNVQFTPTLTITTQNINVGDTAIITVNLPVDATGSVGITVNGKTYTEAVSNGSAVFNVSGLSNATHIITASYNGDKKYLKVSNTSSIAVSKIKTSIGVKASDINVGDTESITVTVNVSDATGSVSITVDGKNYTSSISGGQAVFSINALAEGTYTIKATYNGDNKYLLSSNGTVSFTVSKNSISPVGDNKTSVEVTPNDNGTATVTVNVPSDATGNVTVTVDGKNYTVPVVNGTASVVVDDYTNGSNISVSYSGDDKYDGFNHTGVLSDDGVKFNIDMTVTSDKEVYVAGETAVITITLPEDSTGNVTIMVNNKPVDTVLLSSGNIVFDYVIPSKGGFTVEAVFNGDKKYTAVHNSTVFTAVKANSTIIINVDDTPYDKNPVITVILPDDASGNVTITVDGKDYTEEVSNGKAVFNLPLLDRDTYPVTAVYSGDDKYNGNNNQSEFDVVNKVADLDIKVDSIVYGETANVTVKVADNVTGYITVTSGDNTYFAFIENGTAKLSVPNLEPGLNNITVYYSGDDEYQEKTVTSVIPVARLSSSTEVFVEDITQGDVLNVTVRVSGDASGNVTITIAGKNYTGSFDNGMVIIPVSGLGPGNYTVTALYLGDKYYNESSDVSSFVVKANMTVFAYEMTRGYNSGLDYSVYLTDDLGNPLVNTNVVISVGGVDYNVRTDGNGVASLNAKLAVGSHTISIVNPVTGEETHSNLTIASRLIENKNIVTYYNSGYVYKVRVIGDDGNPVGAGVKFTIKINGKSYTYTTDKDGYLNIKINKRFTASSSKKNRVYKISLSYKGYTVKNTITIKQVLKSKRIVKVKKSAKRIVLKATLKQGKKALKGKVIKFKFKGKTYKVKTNKKGIAKVKISKKVLKKLKAGKNYKVKITYLTDTIKTYVKVKK